MVCLVIEEMRDRKPVLVLAGLRIDHAGVAKISTKRLFGQRVGPLDDGAIGILACLRQLAEVVIQLLIETACLERLTKKPAKPDPVGQKDMIERAMDGFEEGATVLASLRIRKLRADRVQTVVHPLVVACHVSGLFRAHCRSPISERLYQLTTTLS